MKQTPTGQVDCEPHEATYIWLCLPGPMSHRMLPVVYGNTTRKGTPCWSWNGDTEKPTIKPSILTRGGDNMLCHSFVNDGKVKFLDDCTYEYAGKTLDLLNIH